MSDLGDLELIISSRIPLVAVESREERRIVSLFEQISKRTGQRLFCWSVSQGLTQLGGDHRPQRQYIKPPDMLSYIRTLTVEGIFLLLDFHPYLDDPLNVRLLREIAQAYDQAARTLVIVGPSLDLPDELTHHAARFELALPGLEELEALVLEEARGWNGRNLGERVKTTTASMKSLTRNLLGLTLADARRLVRTAIYNDGAITDDDIGRLLANKYALLGQDGLLSLEMETARFGDVAGLTRLKRWLDKRREIFLAQEPEPGFDPPRGLLLLGVQGGGKSLAAKAVAGAWRVPLLRLDFAVLYNKYYGETERNLRESLKTAGSMAPCVLWIDEIEKGLATDEVGGGPSRRILGSLLTWMAERKAKVFMVATANDVEALPPELLRKGRFDEIFFVDLPAPDVRAAIFAIHLSKRAQDPSGFPLDGLAAGSDGFSGAEIEQAVVAALYTARAEGKGLAAEHLARELDSTRPLSILMAEKVARLRAWAAERTVPAD